MNIRTKKVLAREFIVLTITMILAILAFLGTFPYSCLLNKRIADLIKTTESLNSKSDSLSLNYDRKVENQTYFFSELKNQYEDIYKTKEELFFRLNDLLKKDSIKYKWDRVWDKELIEFHKSLGFLTPESFTQFISQNLIQANDSLLKHNADSLKLVVEVSKTKLASLKAKSFSLRDRVNFSLLILVSAFLLLFLIRYFIYGIRWSIRILKEDNRINN